MDKQEIKRQISYWEAQLKEGEKRVKVQQDQNGVIKNTLKGLRSLLGKEVDLDKYGEANGTGDETSLE
jgi:hypothetical protein